MLPSIFDGVGMGLGFTAGLTAIGIFRELLGAGTIFGLHIMPDAYVPMAIFVRAPGAFFVLAALTCLQNKFKLPSATNVQRAEGTIACGGNCSNCSGEICAANHAVLAQERERIAAEAAAKRAAAAKEAAAKKAAAQTDAGKKEGETK